MMNNRIMYTLCRYFASFMLIMYGFAKINESQFTVVDWVLDEPLEDVPGFWLTWYYFGYSTGYKLFISALEIGGGVLLLFRRTTLLASLLLLGVMTNIILIDIFFQIDPGALLMAVFIALCLIIILSHHWSELVEFFWSRNNRANSAGSDNRSGIIGKAILTGSFIIIPFFLTYYIANVNNRSPTPIDGTWDVIEITKNSNDVILPARIYFEYNRAYKARFRYPDSLSHPLHFDVNDADSLEIWHGWLRKDARIFTGVYQPGDNSLEIKGRFIQKDSDVEILLQRVR